jgi:hypothetical protein
MERIKERRRSVHISGSENDRAYGLHSLSSNLSKNKFLYKKKKKDLLRIKNT